MSFFNLHHVLIQPSYILSAQQTHVASTILDRQDKEMKKKMQGEGLGRWYLSSVLSTRVKRLGMVGTHL